MQRRQGRRLSLRGGAASVAASTSTLDRPPSPWGEYTFGRVVGRGRFADARLLVHDEHGEADPSRVYVLKQLADGSVESDSADCCLTTAQAAAREVEILSLLRHPNVLRCCGAFAAAGVISIVTAPYADGGTLEARLRKHARAAKPLDRALVCGWALELASALQHIHARGVLHRDLKAANVLLASGAALARREAGPALEEWQLHLREHVLIADFGVSKRVHVRAREDAGRVASGEGAHERGLHTPAPEAEAEAEREHAGTCIGTPYYLSPEVVLGRPYGSKNDVWCLGVVLYETLALRRPFEGANISALAQAIVGSEPAPLPLHAPPGLVRLVGAMLAKNCARRASSAQVLRAAKAVARAARAVGTERAAASASHQLPARAPPPLKRPSSEALSLVPRESFASCLSHQPSFQSVAAEPAEDEPAADPDPDLAAAELDTPRSSRRRARDGAAMDARGPPALSTAHSAPSASALGSPVAATRAHSLEVTEAHGAAPARVAADADPDPDDADGAAARTTRRPAFRGVLRAAGLERVTDATADDDEDGDSDTSSTVASRWPVWRGRARPAGADALLGSGQRCPRRVRLCAPAAEADGAAGAGAASASTAARASSVCSRGPAASPIETDAAVLPPRRAGRALHAASRLSSDGPLRGAARTKPWEAGWATRLLRLFSGGGGSSVCASVCRLELRPRALALRSVANTSCPPV